MPAENDPAEPNALMQSLQLICSLTPSSTEPSTRLVIIWLKRCCARPLIDEALEFAPVGVGVGVGEGLGEGVGVGVAVGVGVGVGVPVDGVDDCADADMVCAGSSTSETAAVKAAETIQPVAVFIMAIVSARTTCRSDRRRRPAASRRQSR